MLNRTVMVLLLSLAALQAADPSADEHFRRGAALFDQRQLDDARAAFRKAVELAPAARHWKALGAVDAAAGDYEAAEPSFDKACRLDPGEEDACYFHGRALYALDRFEAALAALTKAQPRDRQPWRVHLGTAQALEALARNKEAEHEYRLALNGSTATADLDPRLHFGVFLQRQGRAEEALRQLEAAPRSARSHYEQGRVLVQLSRIDQAEAQLRRAVELDPRHSAAHLLLGKVYYRLGRTADAERHTAQGSRTSR